MPQAPSCLLRLNTWIPGLARPGLGRRPVARRSAALHFIAAGKCTLAVVSCLFISCSCVHAFCFIVPWLACLESDSSRQEFSRVERDPERQDWPDCQTNKQAWLPPPTHNCIIIIIISTMISLIIIIISMCISSIINIVYMHRRRVTQRC